MKKYTVFVESSYLNVANFLVFEVLIISFVFFLTSDISGRLNYRSLLTGEAKRLFVLSPPLLGGGLCSTSVLSAALMLVIRAFALLIVLGTALSMDGRTINVRRTHEALVYVPTPITKNITFRDFAAAVSRRGSCQTTQDGFIYFGIIYAGNSTKCEVDVRNLDDQIRFKLAPDKINVLCKGVSEDLFHYSVGALIGS
eukprot:IDg13884t1